MADGSGCSDAPEDRDELPPGISAWFAIEACVGETLNALEALDGETDQAVGLVSGIHKAVSVWLSWELWACLLGPGHYTPDSLLAAVLEDGVDTRQVGGPSPAALPRPGQAHEWRAFKGGNSE